MQQLQVDRTYLGASGFNSNDHGLNHCHWLILTVFFNSNRNKKYPVAWHKKPQPRRDVIYSKGNFFATVHSFHFPYFV
jgi:hypothetical protein